MLVKETTLHFMHKYTSITRKIEHFINIITNNQIVFISTGNFY